MNLQENNRILYVWCFALIFVLERSAHSFSFSSTTTTMKRKLIGGSQTHITLFGTLVDSGNVSKFGTDNGVNKFENETSFGQDSEEEELDDEQKLLDSELMRKAILLASS